MTATLSGPTREGVSRGRRGLLTRRASVDRMLGLAQYLTTSDRLLIEQIYRHGMSASQIARVMNGSPRRMQRRVRRLIKRLNDPLFNYVVAHYGSLPRGLRGTARRLILQGYSLRDTARLTRQSVHQVRQNLQAIRILGQQADEAGR